MENIYLNLGLFLDPPITDEAALKADIEKRISGWNRMINVDSKNKIRVSKAKEYIAQGFSNLHEQATAACNEILQSLRDDIKSAGHGDGINEAKLKRLKSKYKAFFSDGTIENEIHKAGTGTYNLTQNTALPSVFVVPQCPDSLACVKKVSYRDMQNIADDLSLIDGGRHAHLYDLLQVSSNTQIAFLSKKAQEKSTYALKMPKSNPQADPMGRLTGKCINFFKDEQNKKSYDIALRRFPFDALCESDFCWNIDKDNGIPWTTYQKSIHETVRLGFSQEESEWLVYEYYCKSNKCPDPIINKNSSSAYKIKEQFTNAPFLPTAQQIVQEQFTIAPVLPGARQIAPEKRYEHVKYPVQTDNIEKSDFDSVYQIKGQPADNPFTLDVLRIVPTEQSTDNPFLSGTEQIVQEEQASDNPFTLDAQHIVQEKKHDTKYSDQIDQIKQRFVDGSPSGESVQQLILGKQWFTLFHALEGTEQPDYIAVFKKAEKRIAEFERNIPTIRRTIQRGNIGIVRKQLIKTKDYIADHPEYVTLSEEIKQFEKYVSGLKAEFKTLAGQGRLILAENKLRQFLVQHPSKSRYDFVGFAQSFSVGVQRFQDLIRVCLFALLGGFLFVIIASAIMYGAFLQSNSSYVGMIAAIFAGFLFAEIVYSYSIRLLYAKTGIPFRHKGFGYLGTAGLCLLASIFGCLFGSASIIAQGDAVVLATLQILVGWLLSYLLHVYFFSFFQRCEETARPQPVLLPFIGNTMFIILLSAAGFEWIKVDPTVREIIIHPFTIALLFWCFTALTAIFDILLDIGFMRLKMDIADYRQRYLLLQQYRNTDFCKPLLQTDWYQMAFTISQQKQTQQTIYSKKQ